jgi:subtilase family serine protease
LSSSRPVSPALNTVYTLTAKNAAGTVKATAQVIVTSSSPPPAAGLPDLIVEDITRSGDTISYTIRNQGDGNAAASITALVVDGVVKANDPVDPLAAGASRNESFTFTYECSLPNDTIAVRADKDDVLTESDEGNNELSESWICMLYIIPGPLLTLSPDLVITDIWKVSEITGDKIYYKIKNQGLGTAPASTTSLNFYPTINPDPVATDDVPELAGGEEVTRKFGSYNWTGWGFNCTVRSDCNDAVGETDETNNARTEPTAGL